MRVFKLLSMISLLLLFIVGCSEDTPLEPSPSDNQPAVKLSTFNEIQRQVLNPSCAVSGCHAGTNPAANLDLTAANSYNELVDQNSLLDPPRKLVDPGSSAESVLVLILRGTVTPRMPYQAPALSAATIDSIAKWIDQGALNN